MARRVRSNDRKHNGVFRGIDNQSRIGHVIEEMLTLAQGREPSQIWLEQLHLLQLGAKGAAKAEPATDRP